MLNAQFIPTACTLLHLFFSLPVFSEGIYWMNIVSPKLIYCCSNRVIEVFSLNHLCDFWALSRCSVTSLSLVTCKGKSSRVMAIGNDSRLVKHFLLCKKGDVTLFERNSSRVKMLYKINRNKN